MSGTFSGDSITIPMSANADLNSYQYYFVAASGTAKGVNVATGGCAPRAIGVLQNDPRAGEAAQVKILGTTQVYANGDNAAIAYGDWVVAASDGQAQLAAASAVNGQALQALASGCKVLIEVLLTPYLSAFADETP